MFYFYKGYGAMRNVIIDFPFKVIRDGGESRHNSFKMVSMNEISAVYISHKLLPVVSGLWDNGSMALSEFFRDDFIFSSSVAKRYLALRMLLFFIGFLFL